MAKMSEETVGKFAVAVLQFENAIGQMAKLVAAETTLLFEMKRDMEVHRLQELIKQKSPWDALCNAPECKFCSSYGKEPEICITCTRSTQLYKTSGKTDNFQLKKLEKPKAEVTKNGSK